MNIDNMTYGELKQIAAMFQAVPAVKETLSSMIGQKCIIRTYSAGVFFWRD